MMRLLLRSYRAPVSNANLYKHSVPPGPNNSGHRQFTHCPEIVTTIAGGVVRLRPRIAAPRGASVSVTCLCSQNIAGCNRNSRGELGSGNG